MSNLGIRLPVTKISLKGFRKSTTLCHAMYLFSISCALSYKMLTNSLADAYGWFRSVCTLEQNKIEKKFDVHVS